MNPLTAIMILGGGLVAWLFIDDKAKATRPDESKAAADHALRMWRDPKVNPTPQAMRVGSKVKSSVPQGGRVYLVTLATPTGEIDMLVNLDPGVDAASAIRVVGHRSNGLRMDATGALRPMLR